jgi:hypothetical protein
VHLGNQQAGRGEGGDERAPVPLVAVSCAAPAAREGSGMIYTDAQRKQISEEATGRVIKSLEWESEDGYWVMTFTDDSEICFRLMAELI